jgi:hypothetical protein
VASIHGKRKTPEQRARQKFQRCTRPDPHPHWLGPAGAFVDALGRVL